MSWQTERARVASLTRSRTPDDPELLEARRNLKAARIEEGITRLVADAPPLTDIQRDAIIAAFAGFNATGSIQ